MSRAAILALGVAMGAACVAQPAQPLPPAPAPPHARHAPKVIERPDSAAMTEAIQRSPQALDLWLPLVFEVDTEGRTRRVVALDKTGDDLIDMIVLDWARRFRFEPEAGMWPSFDGMRRFQIPLRVKNGR